MASFAAVVYSMVFSIPGFSGIVLEATGVNDAE